MSNSKKHLDASGGKEKWANFRFSVIGPLLAALPESGRLTIELDDLAKKMWRHPINGDWRQFGRSTIERWYYRALKEPNDPVGVLAGKVREDLGTHPSMSTELGELLTNQYRQHPGWSYQLHADNLVALVEQDPKLGKAPSYPSVLRFMQAHGLIKRPRRGRGHTAGVEAAEKRFEGFEIRSYESEYVNALWHTDFHHGSLKVLLPDGQWSGVEMMGVLDDCSRLCVHAQWYLAETAQNLIHGLTQGIEKHELPRALMSDRGSAMLAAETVQGLARLGIVHETTLPYSPYQNGKQEVFWAQAEGRLLPMLEGCKDLTLAQLNQATMAWIEMEYNRRIHSELGESPLSRFVTARSVGRPCPESKQLHQAFTAGVSRTQRQSDGTISLEGIRFELPSRYRHLKHVTLRYPSWDLSQVYLSDPNSGQVICRLFPQDKHKNSDGRRRRKEPLIDTPRDHSEGDMAPLLRKLIAEYAATGLPPAYLPKDECAPDEEGK
ncbi:MAG: DDE-type integrase/transposase/recombinase [Proteobacteria bacterium]|nr:DDE-type integrase/transposase/recombinase [Pseudomonadota bacterium]